MAELKPCPFCGGEAEMHFQSVYTDSAVCVVCAECKARTRLVLFDCKYIFYRGEQNVFVTQEEAEDDVTELWNRRNGEKQDGELSALHEAIADYYSKHVRGDTNAEVD